MSRYVRPWAALPLALFVAFAVAACGGSTNNGSRFVCLARCRAGRRMMLGLRQATGHPYESFIFLREELTCPTPA